jgi:type I restriction enzyme R subunit
MIEGLRLYPEMKDSGVPWLGEIPAGVLQDDTELFKQFSDNPDFRRWLEDNVFRLTYTQSGSCLGAQLDHAPVERTHVWERRLPAGS